MDVKLPNLGEGADSGVVVNVFVKEGDQIARDQPILELENEKAVASIPSPVSGTVAKLRVKVGDKISVGQLILSVSEDSGAVTKASDTKTAVKATEDKVGADQAPVPPEEAIDKHEAEPAHSQRAPVAAPSIRKIARELGIDLAKIHGTERGGRIVLADLRAYLQRLQKLAAQPTPGRAATPPAATAERIDFSKWGEITKKPMSALRKTISRRLVENWTTIPHVTQFDEADVTALLEARKKHAPAYEAKGARLTLTSFTLKVVAAALKKFPMFNASVDELADEIIFKEYYHLGVAVDTDAGLIVPVIRDVDKKDLVTLSRELNELAVKARDRKVALEELKGGTFTISNQGGIGGAHFTPIINKPEVAILGLGRGALKAVVKNGKIEARTMLPLGLSYDHRVIDGGQAARFITELVQGFENFKEADVRLGTE
ncbi:MAG TPA: 2-oxo acid dehydrogenase subunit E2 [Candidatus Eisenbacteria bacterium]|jgi:pyruvate dehydrogenase E2 component (dihydrolipoamide acetyltransferase)|nr:2-oxo acid dehydrogenase subunit E2 [Candidatus Eisenbacteria bacterium]